MKLSMHRKKSRESMIWADCTLGERGCSEIVMMTRTRSMTATRHDMAQNVGRCPATWGHVMTQNVGRCPVTWGHVTAQNVGRSPATWGHVTAQNVKRCPAGVISAVDWAESNRARGMRQVLGANRRKPARTGANRRELVRTETPSVERRRAGSTPQMAFALRLRWNRGQQRGI